MSEIVGVLLAAGLGTRYDPTGECLKLLQPTRSGRHAGAPIVVAAVRNLRPAVARVVVVIRPRSDPHQAQLHDLLSSEGCELVVCGRAADGMGASLADGIQAAPTCAGTSHRHMQRSITTLNSVADALRAGTRQPHGLSGTAWAPGWIFSRGRTEL